MRSPSPFSLSRVPSRLLTNHRVKEAKEVFGSDDDTHPGVKHLFSTAKDFYVGGKLEAVQRLEHYDFLDLRCKPLSPFPSKHQQPPITS